MTNPATDKSPLPDLFAEIPSAFRDAYDPAAPWDLLGEPLQAVLDALPSSAIDIPVSPDFHLAGDRIVIGKGSRIAPGVVMEGPIFVGENVQIRAGAYLRGGCWIGDGCTVGANTEVKHSILFPGAAAPHLNYVGDSVLGTKVNLGAGTVLSNFRHDGRGIAISLGEGRKLPTGRRKLGAVLGDRVATGCNSVLHPGVVVGRETQIYPGAMLRSGIYPAKSVVKLNQQQQVVERS